MKTNDTHPERISFSEITSILEKTVVQENTLQILGKDIGMWRAGHKLFNTLLQSGTPYIIEDSRIALIKAGEANMTINLIDYTLKKGRIVFIGAGSIVQVNSCSEDYELCGIMASNERMNMICNEGIPAAYKGNAYSFVITPDLSDISIIDNLFLLAWKVGRQRDCPAEVIDGIFYSLLHYYHYLKNKHNSDNGGSKPHHRMMFDQFVQLVNAHSKKEHALSFYADRMCVTPRYLGVVIKETSGIPAKEWIDRSLITHAKIMLRYGSMSIAQVADELGFPNPSFFCKYFKRITGVTPHEFRQWR